eukprot:3105505-Ditylum_brightwellii.AAC.1
MDVSVVHKKGYFAVVFHSADKSICFQGPCDGNSSLMTSYRMELTGILSALYLLQALIKYKHTALQESLLLYCDNISVVNATNTVIWPGIKQHVSSDFDIIKEIHDTKQGLASFSAHWVKACQDNMKQLDDLTLEARLNVIADSDVNSFCLNPLLGLKPFSTPTMFPSLKVFLKINSCTVTGKMKQFLRDSYTGSDIFEHTRTKTGLSIDNMNKIDWDNLGTTLENQHLFNKVRLVKLVHNWLNKGHQKKQIDKNAVNTSPICLDAEETWRHLFQCQYKDSIAIRTVALTLFKSELLQIKTTPILQEVLYYKVAQWCKLPSTPVPLIPDDEVGYMIRDAVEAQNKIGWDNCIKG